MAYELSFSKKQWWAAIVATVAIFVLTFAIGFVGGALWERARAQEAQPATAAAPTPEPPAAAATPASSPGPATTPTTGR